MTVTLERPNRTRITTPNPANGGFPARRAIIHWAWRLFRREWRQQLLVLSLIVVAVAAVVIGATVATNTPQVPAFGFGSAQDMATFGPSPQMAVQIAHIEGLVGRVDVISNQALSIPGSINTYSLRSQNPNGPYGGPLIHLVSGNYPTGTDEVAVTAGVARDFNLSVGDTFKVGGVTRKVVGIVENPQSLLDEFALVVPGQVTHPTQVTLLFDADGVPLSQLGSNAVSRAQAAATNNGGLDPTTIVLALTTLGMLLIALVAVGGFTVLAQRRLRSIGMLGSLGATDDNVRLVVSANGAVVGVVGAIGGLVLGLVGWLAYRPHAEASSHHLIGAFALPWDIIGPAVVLAVLAAFLAATRPARAVAKVPIVAALSGRPAPPRRARRSAVPAIVFVGISVLLLGYSGAQTGGGGGAQGALVLGFVTLIVAIILIAPLTFNLLARLVGRAPVAVRLAVRDLARYRSRSGSALGAISLGIFIAVVITVAATARYSNTLDYVGPNLASNQLIIYNPNGPGGMSGPVVSAGAGGSGANQGKGGPQASPEVTAQEARQELAAARAIATGLGTHDLVPLITTSANLQHAAAGRNFGGTIYIATPQLLAAFGISPSSINPAADILSMRSGLATMTDMQLTYGSYQNQNPPPNLAGQQGYPFACPGSTCIANPVIQTVSALPGGTSAPNTVITEHAVKTLHLPTTLDGWFIKTPQVLTAAQLSDARIAAGGAGLSIESKNDEPTSAEIINWATVFGIALALGILAMSVGLIRSETARDLRTLTATGASGRTRRSLTAATAGSLALLGAVLGTAGGYLAAGSWFRSSSLNGGLSALANVPVSNLLVILVGLPLVAAIGGWLLGGRNQAAMNRQPLD